MMRKAYIRQVFSQEIDRVATAPEGMRSEQLNLSAYRLGQYQGRGWLKSKDIVAELECACYVNGFIQEHGMRLFMATMMSGLQKGNADAQT